MNIEWGEVPEGYPLWIEDLRPTEDDFSGWYKELEDRYADYHGGFLLKGAEGKTYIVHRRAAEPAWNGEGLPPVGTVCELQDATEVRILAHTKRAGAPVAVYQCKDSESIEAYTASFFRPIRTPEQTAAEEREKAVKAIYERANKEGMSVLSMLSEAYEAGRKVKP